MASNVPPVTPVIIPDHFGHPVKEAPRDEIVAVMTDILSSRSLKRRKLYVETRAAFGWRRTSAGITKAFDLAVAEMFGLGYIDISADKILFIEPAERAMRDRGTFTFTPARIENVGD